MTFDEILTQVIALLQREGRVSYRARKICFDLDDDYLEGLKDELIVAKRLAADEDGKVLVWRGRETGKETGNRGTGEEKKELEEQQSIQMPDARRQTLDAKSDHMTFVHFTTRPRSVVILSAAKNLIPSPFAALRVTALVCQSSVV